MKGDTAVGSKLEVWIEPPEGRGMTFKPTVRASEPGREFRWLRKLLLPPILDAEHQNKVRHIALGVPGRDVGDGS